MESGSLKETDRRKLSPVAHKESDGKSETTERPPEQDVSTALPEQQLLGKPKKTPFKFFGGGRRSICTLPSFFSGRSKGHGKGASKKGISKSKTHDGIIDVAYEGRKERANSTAGETGSPQQETTVAKILPSSKSAHLVIDTGSKLDFSSNETLPLGSSEGFDKKHNEDRLFPRPKKGLKGLLSSIRRHKKNKTLDSEKVEPCEFVAVAVSVEQVIKKPEIVSEVPEDGVKRNLVNTCVATAVADSSNGKEDDHAISGDSVEMANSEVTNEIYRKADELATDVSEIGSPVVNTSGELIYSDSEHNGITGIGNADEIDNDLPSVHSCRSHSLVFSDVTSLKSFDSFTGCGDIIADQDIDSIAESTSSVERSRETTKRSSCLVTYQGGGEDMATPDEIEEEYLQQLWESAAEADITYEGEPLQAVNDHGEVQAVSNQPVPPSLCKDITQSYVDGTVEVTVDLTPQSDQQESVPNSDEGYYDSTTPGPEDEVGDDQGHDIKERLPRDSYSGDALYEFYEPDDDLSPPAIGDVFFDSNAPYTELFEHCLDFGLSFDKSLIQISGNKSGVMETEEERLAAIQKQLLYWDLKQESLLTRLERPSQECSRQKQSECKNRSSNTVVRQQIYPASKHVASQNSSRTGGDAEFSVSEPEIPSRRDVQSVHCLEKFSGVSCSQKAQGACLNPKTTNSTFDSDLDGTGIATQGHSGLGQTNTEKYSNYRNVDDHDNCRKKECLDVVGNGHSNSRENEMEGECEQVISFSQALVDFTSNGTLFSSLSESLGSSDSGSSFTQNLQALPTMVTFDIVDVENEGEFDQQMDVNTDAEVTASFETFDDSYVQKESVAYCDNQMFPMGTQSSFHGFTWGVTSLPRHLSLYHLNPSMPSPLSLNRRSRSLDTESLELELANMHVSKSSLKSRELSAKQEERKDSIGCGFNSRKERVQPFYSDRTEADQIGSYYCHSNLPSENIKGWRGIVPDGGAAVLEKDLSRSAQPEIDTLLVSSTPTYSRLDFDWRPRETRAGNPITLSPRQVVRPSHLPLQTNGRQSQEVSETYRHYGEKKLALVLPLDERKGVSLPHGLCFSQSSEDPVKFKPIGVTQGMPQCNASNVETLKHSANYAEHFESSHKTMLKGRIDHGNNLPGRWHSSYGECNSLSCGEEGCS
ncbi:LOW QUALITY PROTEIN: APC membrane recruitment protein 1 [Microcaecilia unicolor]|uniref:LOW QUALITY PROTEIN: APC membrane recruitment protein 1 n=1 Tax=Microcaecilia unicolor TaxID=1415580 RepID=A0A6P7YLK0_9AMPH|nr:LOW QUALITY PROTEIN: APC membrane recruitment protein 1 [Microcaecilia unicolor]